MTENEQLAKITLNMASKIINGLVLSVRLSDNSHIKADALNQLNELATEMKQVAEKIQ